MFTGIIQSIGSIRTVTPVRAIDLSSADAGVRLDVHAGDLDCTDVAIGDSISVSGACLTVVSRSASDFQFDVSMETLRCTHGLAVPGDVNLEKALRFGDRLGGHLVSGHVDGVGVVVAFRPAGESYRLEIEAPKDLARFIAVKGSITVDGVSLTVNAVEAARFTLNLIPHTLAVTTLGRIVEGQRVNLEVDLLARYLERLVADQGLHPCLGSGAVKSQCAPTYDGIDARDRQ